MKLLKPSEVAERLGVKESTLEAWRCRGGGPALAYVKIGHAVRYREPDLARLIAENLHDREAAA
ncbi:MAG: helix-turn-helix domain-containing protein [Xanthomonadales bacterium]|nr:helix-turn-helix domain-containing protein [Xanthomonadales bacterium]